MLNILNDACNHVTPEDWKKVVKRTKRIIDEEYDRDVQFDSHLETELIINLEDCSSEESESDEDLGCTALY